MTKHYSILLFALVVLFGACGCEKKAAKDEPKQEQAETADMSLVTPSVPVTDNWVWSGKPQITIQITNGNPNAVRTDRLPTTSRWVIHY